VIDSGDTALLLISSAPVLVMTPALVIGAVAAPVSCYAIQFVKGRQLVDESLDVFACHGLGGLWGARAPTRLTCCPRSRSI
jgi:Amt family ammonium transporter